MRDGIDTQFMRLATELESAVVVRPPTSIRGRGEVVRRERRRRGAFALATAMAVVGVGVGGVVALRPGDRPSVPVGGPVGSSAPRSAPAPSHSGPGVTKASAVVDLEHDVMTVSDSHGNVVRMVPVTGGSAAYPSRTGSYTVTEKKPTMSLAVANAGLTNTDDTYRLTVDWVLILDGNGPRFYAAPSRSGTFGKGNTTHGDIEMGTADAQWLYGFLSVGDNVEIR